ncbi:Aste57867_18230 [Aphanomyces stellatus]|uniref:Aste57867_18230 protein n=1 Tax=Aphanomyces stellatus TaxID=120398 RepID=A0A485L9J0_9STRA|nr:hypothetical protein As57867_018168 [Aphanomyces stellatus]VFT94968.1 Aste57867_18230 [Aphanomyces stellatus]
MGLDWNPNAIITVYPDDTDEYPEDSVPPTGVTLMWVVQYSSSITIPCPEKPLLMSQFAGGFNFGTAVSALEVHNDPYTPYFFHGKLDAWLRRVHPDAHGVLSLLQRPEEHV